MSRSTLFALGQQTRFLASTPAHKWATDIVMLEIVMTGEQEIWGIARRGFGSAPPKAFSTVGPAIARGEFATYVSVYFVCFNESCRVCVSLLSLLQAIEGTALVHTWVTGIVMSGNEEVWGIAGGQPVALATFVVELDQRFVAQLASSAASYKGLFEDDGRAAMVQVGRLLGCRKS